MACGQESYLSRITSGRGRTSTYLPALMPSSARLVVSSVRVDRTCRRRVARAVVWQRLKRLGMFTRARYTCSDRIGNSMEIESRKSAGECGSNQRELRNEASEEVQDSFQCILFRLIDRHSSLHYSQPHATAATRDFRAFPVRTKGSRFPRIGQGGPLVARGSFCADCGAIGFSAGAWAGRL